MRAIRVLTAALLVLPAATALAAPAAAISPSYTAVTGNGDPYLSDGNAFAYDGAAVAVTTHTTNEMQFDVTAPATKPNLTVTITAPTGGPLVAGSTNYVTSATATDSAPGFTITEPSGPCSSVAGRLRIDQLATDSVDTSSVTAFAAHYEFDCDGNADSISGELRYASDVGYSAFTQTQSNWSFGTQLVNRDGWAKRFTFTNRGTAAQTFSAAVTTSSLFKVKSDGCKVAGGIAAGASCTVTVAPHPTAVTAPADAELHVTPTGLPTLVVQLEVLGSDFATFWADAGAQRVDVNWGQLPAPFNAFAGSVTLYRSTSKSTSAMKAIRTTTSSEYVDHPAAGHTYYYAVRPHLVGGQLGDWSPFIAARPWPKYSAGMYHRLPAPVRFVSSHRVSAGHPYALRVLGVHGVPSSHVSAVALNVTVAGSSATTQVYVYPYGTKRPAAADVAVRAHDTRSNFVLAKVGSHGKVTISTAHGSVPVTVDVSGYFSATGLSSSYGQGGAPHVFGYYDKVVDTKGWHWGALKSGWAVDCVDGSFSPSTTRHVSSLIVEVTAYGSKGSGTLTGFTTNGRPGKTSVLSYRPGVTTSSVAIIRASAWTSPTSGNSYPSVSLLNRGPKPVQLIVTVIGFVDDNTLLYGQRYVPTAPVHLLGAKMGAGANRTITPGSHGGYWTSGFNTKVAASNPSRTTTVSLRGIGLGAAPSHGQLTAPAHVNTVSSTFASAGRGNRIGVHNSAGTVRLDVWSFGRFDFYPLPTTTPSFASVTVPWREGSGTAAPVSPRVRRLN